MPNGFTAAIHDGKDTSLRSYLMQVGRGMGFAIQQRDDDPKAPVEPVSDGAPAYYTEAIERVRKRVEWLSGLSAEECEAEAAKDYAEKEARYAKLLADDAAVKARYLAMKAEVQAWPGVPSLPSVKEFALKYLDDSIKFDCGSDYCWAKPNGALSGAQWLSDQQFHATEEIERHAGHIKEEQARNRERNRYINDFLASLPSEDSDA